MNAESGDLDGGPVMFAVLVVYLAGIASGIAASIVWGWL